MQLKPALIVDFRQDGSAADFAPFDPELKETVELFDQDKEVFVFNREEELDQAKELVSRHGYEAEPMNLVLLPPHAERTGYFRTTGLKAEPDTSTCTNPASPSSVSERVRYKIRIRP